MTKNNSFLKGKSLKEDFRRLINDENFYDIALKCSDGKVVFGCKVILATRSGVFNRLILERSELSFDDINSNAMKAILQYLYTSEIDEKDLTVENVIEVYHASVRFELLSLQKDIIDRTKILLKKGKDNGKKLLTQYVNKFNTSPKIDNRMSEILVDWVAKSSRLNEHEIHLSLEGLKYLLMKTIDTEKPFATPEIEVWGYVLMKAKGEFEQNQTSTKKVSDKKSVYSQQEIKGLKNYLTPFIGCINLNRMDAKEIREYVEPFNIFSVEEIKDVYYSKTQNEGSGFIRGVPIFKWEKYEQLTVSDDGYIVEVVENLTKPKSTLGDLTFKGEGVYKWDILIEKLCGKVYIGVCDMNEVKTLNRTDQEYRGWVLGSDGYAYHNNKYIWYDAKFKRGDRVTVHLNMKMKTCAFSINKNMKPIVSEWKDIPSQVCPIASFLEHGSKLRIEPHIPRDFYNRFSFLD